MTNVIHSAGSVTSANGAYTARTRSRAANDRRGPAMRSKTRRIQAKWIHVRRGTRARGTTTDCSADTTVKTTINEPATTAAIRTPTTPSRWQTRVGGDDHRVRPVPAAFQK